MLSSTVSLSSIHPFLSYRPIPRRISAKTGDKHNQSVALKDHMEHYNPDNYLVWQVPPLSPMFYAPIPPDTLLRGSALQATW